VYRPTSLAGRIDQTSSLKSSVAAFRSSPHCNCEGPYLKHPGLRLAGNMLTVSRRQGIGAIERRRRLRHTIQIRGAQTEPIAQAVVFRHSHIKVGRTQADSA